MKQIHVLILGLLLFIGCNGNEEASSVSEKRVDAPDLPLRDPGRCLCSIDGNVIGDQIEFQGWDFPGERNDVLYRRTKGGNGFIRGQRKLLPFNSADIAKWGQDSIDNVTSLTFIDYDTIPEVYKRFKNVRRVTIDNSNGIKGLDIFPKLRRISFFLSAVSFDSTEHWSKEIEVMHVQKSTISGLRSFKKFPNLTSITLEFSSFDKFPKDVETLACLQELVCDTYTGADVDLSAIDVSGLKCLQRLYFATWRNNLTGIPCGINAAPSLMEVKVEHQKLTRKEKNTLRSFVPTDKASH
jgi:hypothetical protein